jgi:PilZ domain
VALLYDRYDDNEDTGESEKKYLRAGVRVNSRVKVAVERKEDGRAARAEGHTMDISAHGCMAIVPEGFEVGETLLLTNLINQKECEAVLVWRGHHGTTGWELGLQLRDPASDFWELEF